MSGCLLVIGAGGHGRVVADAALAMSKWREVAFVDDHVELNRRVLDLPILGSTESLAALRSRYQAVVVAVGAASERLRLLDRCCELGFEVPIIIHPASWVSRFAILKEGCVVCAHSVVSVGAILGRGCIVNTASSVDHDCVLDAGVHICPGARLAGDVHVGSNSWIGIGSCVRQGIVIGSGATVGAGAVVVSNVASGATVMGNPARERSTK